MKKSEMFLVAVLMFATFWLVKCYAATEIESINVNFAGDSATEYFEQGNFAYSNSVLTNGDTVEYNTFVPDGETSTVQVSGNAFKQIFGGLIQESAVNMDALTNATLGQTGVYIASTDETLVNDFGNVQTNSGH